VDSLPNGWTEMYDEKLKRFVILDEHGRPLLPPSRISNDKWKAEVINRETQRRRH